MLGIQLSMSIFAYIWMHRWAHSPVVFPRINILTQITWLPQRRQQYQSAQIMLHLYHSFAKSWS